MSLSVNGVSPVSYSTAPPTQPNDGASFEQLLSQLASNYGMSPQELFNMLTSYANQPTTGGSPVSGPGGSGGVDNEKLQEVLGQFAANTLNAGQGMVKEAMEKFFQEEEEPDEGDPDSEPL